MGWRNRCELNLLLGVGRTGMGLCERSHEHSGSVKHLPKRRYVKHTWHRTLSTTVQ